MHRKERAAARLKARSATPISTAAAVMLALASVGAAAEEVPVVLKAGSGLDKVEGHCAACHSLDYIRMNSPFLDAAGWDAEVSKMINAYGAPISAADAKTIADYLKANYGK
jgi:mono/diheme cytochrome c family protein